MFYLKEEYKVIDSPKLMKAELEIRDPICRGKNMTRNSYMYGEIKVLFREMLERCFGEGRRDCG